MIRGIFICAALFLFMACGQMHQAQTRQTRSALPAIHITTDTGSIDLQIAELNIAISVAGNFATTKFDLLFYNDLDRVLEGEFDFPLAEGQSIASYALEMNGKLREGVVVEKAKARKAYENTVRKGIDPGLVEKAKGNNFRTRIYPIPAKGYKRVVIGIEEVLPLVNDAHQYQLPLYAKELIRKFSIAADLIHVEQVPDLKNNELAGFQFNKNGKEYTGSLVKNEFLPNQVFAFSLPVKFNADPVVLTDNFEGKTYFYTQLNFKPDIGLKEKPSVIGLLWDISASSDKRNREKEMALLDQYLSAQKDVKVLLIPFHITALPSEEFLISNGNTALLMQRMKEFSYDGGTQLGALDLSTYSVNEFLLFSDGISSFGKKEITLGKQPVIAISSSPSADFSYLKFLAETSHGKFLNLLVNSPENAKTEMETPSCFVNTASDPGQVEELITKIDPANHTVSLSGILKTRTANITLRLNNGQHVKPFEWQILIAADAKENYEQVKRIWATMQINQLDLRFDLHKERITELGKKFSIVTRNTSLLVLDQLEDYLTYEITPPEEMQKEYFALLKERKTEKTDEKALAFNDALQAMENLKKWWNQTQFTTRKKPLIIRNGFDSARIEGRSLFYTVTDSAVSFNMSTENSGIASQQMPPPPPPPRSPNAPPQVELSDVHIAEINQEGEKSDELVPPGQIEISKFTPPIIKNDEEVLLDKKEETSTSSEIIITEQKQETDYLKAIDKTSHSSRYEKYLELKKQYGHQPAFFVDVARYFSGKHEKDKALLVLSNVAEMKLEDAELLRIMAFQLLEMNEAALAVETLKEVKEIREEDPQSFRDLALALEAMGNYRDAIPLFYQLITGVWDERFGDVRAIAINEMNAVLSAHPDETVPAYIDRRFIYPMPVDVRIVIGWTSDNSDVDLWITDPQKEKCFYKNTATSTGGKISQDVTQGYGPEEFCLRKAPDGEYVIEANLFGDTRQTLGGPITITADLFTDYGRPNQKKKTINFRATSDDEVVKIGVLKFGKP